jgi:hypothetical protein
MNCFSGFYGLISTTAIGDCSQVGGRCARMRACSSGVNLSKGWGQQSRSASEVCSLPSGGFQFPLSAALRADLPEAATHFPR